MACPRKPMSRLDPWGLTPGSSQCNTPGQCLADVRTVVVITDGDDRRIRECLVEQGAGNNTMPDLVLHLRKPVDWAATVNIHYWNARPVAASTAWPGVPMTAEGGDWFFFRFERIAAVNFVFTDSAGRQTGDLWRDREGWYRDGRWYDNRPDRIPASAAQVTPISAAPAGESSPEAIAPRPAPPATTSHGIGLPDFREETIYFLITTRFYDGDPSNNFFCRDRIKFNAAGQPEDPHWRGDFRGPDRPPRLHSRPRLHRDLDHPAGREPIRPRLPRLSSATTGRASTRDWSHRTPPIRT